MTKLRMRVASHRLRYTQDVTVELISVSDALDTTTCSARLQYSVAPEDAPAVGSIVTVTVESD